ncbi:MAG: VWA domain-containing protein [Fidelibacterota bacterium]
MTWRYPIVLLLLVLLVAVLWLVRYFQRHRGIAMTEADSRVRDTLLHRYDFKRIRWKNRFITVGLILLIIASAGPRIGIRVKPVERKGVDLVFAIDVSTSMNAEDIKPSRLEKAKYEIGQVIRKLEGDRVALIVFAGSSHLYLPLTSDYEAALLFLESIETGMIPTQGTALATALNTGISAFSDDEDKHKVLVLVTDGEDHEGEAIEIARKAYKVGFTIHTVGVGSITGSLIPEKKEGRRVEYKKDRQGKLITTALNEGLLNEIAEAGGGIFIRFDNRFGVHRDLVKTINTMEKRTISTHEFSDYEDRYQLFALTSLVLLLIGFGLPTARQEGSRRH